MRRDAEFPIPPLPRRLLAPRYWPTWIGLGLYSLLALVPRRLRDPVAAATGDLRYRLNARRRGIVELNLELCFPERSEAERRALAREHFRAYARAMADLPVLWWDLRRRVPRTRCRVQGLEHVLAAVRDGRPVILVNPHTAAVDFGGIALTPHVRLSSMAKVLRSPVLDWLTRRTRVAYGVHLFPRDGGLRPVVRALQRGTVFYYMPDEDFGARNSVFAPFFGQDKATLTTVARLASMSGAVTIPVYAYYAPESRRYEIVVREPLRDFPAGDAVADATTVNRAMEACIRLRPEAYLWNFRLFRNRPDGSKMEYPRRARRRR
ncbi:MAG: lysophospholipid acyltransferase family protein [Halofilum sp. (in: g-proteobacteria)]|nr:lysophospholipid acyltransferase family protein [Halofilum sp. (in: g-proteobacteria)]